MVQAVLVFLVVLFCVLVKELAMVSTEEARHAFCFSFRALSFSVLVYPPTQS